NRSKKGMTTFGLPWEKGKLSSHDQFQLMDQEGKILPLQSRITGYWPDGSIKWSAHTCNLSGNEPYILEYRTDREKKETGKEEEEGIVVSSVKGKTIIDAGRVRAEFHPSTNH